MKRIPRAILIVIAIAFCSCHRNPIGPVHLRIEAYTAPGDQPVAGAHFIMMGFIESSSYDEGPYTLNETITLSTNSNGILDTIIPSNGSIYYSIVDYYQDPENYLTTFNQETIEKEGSYTYYVGYNYPAYLRCHFDFDQVATNNMSCTIFGIAGPISLHSYPNNLPDTTVIVKIVGGSLENKITIWWPKPNNQQANNTAFYNFSNVAPFDTLDVNLTEP